jgi:hypothetical protein
VPDVPLTAAQLEQVRAMFVDMLDDAITAAVSRIASHQPVTAHAGTIINVDGALATVNTADGGQVFVTRATGATEGERCVVLFVQDGRGFALGEIPQVPNDSQGPV